MKIDEDMDVDKTESRVVFYVVAGNVHSLLNNCGQ